MIKVLEEFPDYAVDVKGNVYSLKFGKTKQLAKLPDSRGYNYVNLYKQGKIKHKKISRIMAEAYLSKIENKPYVNHIDGNKSNDKLENLEWCSQSENMKHAYKHNLSSRVGSKHNLAKIDEAVAKKVKELLKTGLSCHQVSAALNISFSTVKHIKTGDRWKHVD